MWRPTIFIHLGQHKTGTSTIQNWLLENCSELAEAGLFLPQTGMVNGGHHAFFDTYDQRNYSGFSDLLKTLREEIKKSHLPYSIISSEEFERLPLAASTQLLSALDDFDIRGMLYLRRQDGYMASDFGQQVKMGASLPNFDQYLLSPTFPNRFNPLTVVSNWLSSNILTTHGVHLYEHVCKQGPIVDNFRDQIMLTSAKNVESGRTALNTSYGYQLTDLIRETTLAVRAKVNVPSPKLAVIYKTHIGFFEELCDDNEAPLKATNDQISRIANQYGELNGIACSLFNWSPDMRRYYCFNDVRTYQKISRSNATSNSIIESTEFVLGLLNDG